jgi:hypothetical protein
MSQQALAKAVEVSATDEFIINTTGTDQTITASQTLFPNIFALAADINSQIILAGGALVWSTAADDAAFGTGTNKMLVTTTQQLVDIPGALATKLGFNGSESVGGSYFISANYTPEEVWFPSCHSSDQNWFRVPAEALFKGTRGTNGQWSGIVYEARETVNKTWPAEYAYNSIEKAAPADASTAADRLARNDT